MIKLSILTIALFSAMSANAAYVVKIPMEQNLGGHLQNSSIVFVGNTPAEPEQPESPVEDKSITINSTFQKLTDYPETFSIGLYANAGDTKPFASN